MSIYLGLMSGTSMDGIDAAVMDVTTHRLLGGLTLPYTQSLYERLQILMNSATASLEEIWQLNTAIGKEFAQAANKIMENCGVDRSRVTAIGSHGQTIRHEPNGLSPYTIQLGCPHTIAELTGVTVVADFRTRDMVLGGQGAPFAPLYHQAVLSQPDTSVAVVNIGGITNISFLCPGDPTYGYDIGPGNCLMDAWIQLQLGKAYDDDGHYAAQGQVIPELLQNLLADEFFLLPYPKSVCKSYFSLEWLQHKLQPHYAPQDVQATLLMLSAQSIADTIAQHSIQRLALCGGGAHNLALIVKLQSLLPQVEVTSTQALGVDPDFLEAMLFAWLAHQAITGTPVDLRHITGAHKPAILGAIYKMQSL
jgi:anhydro-N-acetylmuramic acid kinase